MSSRPKYPSKANYLNVTKFKFFNLKLHRESKHLLPGLGPNTVNYLKTIELLRERFGQPKKIISAQMRAFFHLPKQGNDLSSLLLFFDKLE